MPTQTYLLQKPSGYYFRFKFPDDIRFLVKKTELRYSLKTRSIELAKSKARVMAGKVQSVIRSIRRGTMEKLTEKQINKLIRKYIIEALEMDEVERIVDDSPYDPEFQKDHVRILGMISNLLKHKLATKDKTFIESSLDEFLSKQNIEADKDSLAYKKLYRDMLKADAHIYEMVKKREQGDYSNDIMPEFLKDASPIPPAVASLPSDLVQKSGKTISQVMTDFFEEGYAESRWTPKTRLEVQASLQVIIDYFGNVPINSIDRKMMGQYKRDIMKLPPRMNLDKQYRNLTIHEILKLKPNQTIAIHTINKLLGRANTLFEYARINGEISLNPAEGMNVKKTKRADEEREIFTQSDPLSGIYNLSASIQASINHSLSLKGIFHG